LPGGYTYVSQFRSPEYIEGLTPLSRQTLEGIPFTHQMPESINFASTAEEICGIALEIVKTRPKNRRLAPELITRLKEVVYGQAIKEPVEN